MSKIRYIDIPVNILRKNVGENYFSGGFIFQIHFNTTLMKYNKFSDLELASYKTCKIS